MWMQGCQRDPAGNRDKTLAIDLDTNSRCWVCTRSVSATAQPKMLADCRINFIDKMRGVVDRPAFAIASLSSSSSSVATVRPAEAPPTSAPRPSTGRPSTAAAPTWFSPLQLPAEAPPRTRRPLPKPVTRRVRQRTFTEPVQVDDSPEPSIMVDNALEVPPVATVDPVVHVVQPIPADIQRLLDELREYAFDVHDEMETLRRLAAS